MFYAITGLGWGKGETAAEAERIYRGIVRRDYPHLSPDEVADAWGFVWQPPSGVSGFVLDLHGDLYWKTDDDISIGAERSERVSPIGNVPEQWA